MRRQSSSLANPSRARLRALIEESLETHSEFIPGVTSIPFGVPTFGAEEIAEATDSLLSRNVTMGKKVADFERSFSEYLGTKNSIMVNSGSSANLIALSVLASRSPGDRIRPGEEVITPAVTWSTTVFPIVSIGAVPVFVDVNLDTLNLDPELLENAVTEKTAAIMPVHFLGNPCDMKAIDSIASAHDLFVIEDACEASGAELDGRKVGTFGDMGTFSFYFSHHISTIEGGMLVTDYDEHADLARSLRAYGWVRDRSDREHLSFDSRFKFVTTGYNLRPTEIQGAFGIHQIKKLEQLIQARQRNASYWTKELSRYSEFLLLPKDAPRFRHVFFAYPLTIRPDAPFNRNDLASYLESKGIETRPAMAGDFTQQPVCKFLPYRIAGDLRNSALVHSQSLLWGNHQGIEEPHRKYVVDCVREFIEQHP